MSIIFNKKTNSFLLNTPSSSYIIRIYDNKYVLHGGWVSRIDDWDDDVCSMPLIDRAFAPVPAELHGKVDFSLNALQQEFPTSGRTDFRTGAFEALCADGTIAADLFYESHKIIKGKPGIKGLPATYVTSESEADTLELNLKDPVTGVLVTLVYTVWNNRDVICRHTIVKNNSGSAEGIYKNQSVKLRRVMSASVDFMTSRYKMLQLSGAHARERHGIWQKLVPGTQSVESRRGTSSHQHNPFIALADYEATETTGQVFGFNLVYSGNFVAGAEVDQFNMSRVQIGINPYNFEWELAAGETFETPEVVMVFSNNGLGELSRTYHDLYRDNMCRGPWQKKERPIVINNWEATYFNFNAEKLFKLADRAAEEGIELFVLDDGWFGKRNDDHSSLGDWFVNTKKLTGGLEEIAEGIHKRGLKFGLWVEPEMISPDSDLYRAHPDWCLHIEGRDRSLGRHQLVLDLSRDDVVDYLIETLSKILSTVAIDYIKWDFNRSQTDVASALASPANQLKTAHKYYLGLYRLLESVTQKFPNVLFESCSGGGGRFDPAFLYYMPQCWTSDNTDGLSRLAIQSGTSIAYPASAMSCHVSAVPNHQTGRVTNISERGHTAMAGTFGYELDLNKLSKPELDEIKEQVALYKKIRSTVQFGDLYRLRSSWDAAAPAESSAYTAWNIVSKDKKQAVLTVSWQFAEGNPEVVLLKLKGLDPKAKYKLTCSTSATIRALLADFPFPLPESTFAPLPAGLATSGDKLMNVGLYLPYMPQYGGSVQIVLEKC
ncbi:MAG: alpha-galactosidase [Treponema sp.]|nr:alpha-galactosidase [Treponema sp.]